MPLASKNWFTSAEIRQLEKHRRVALIKHYESIGCGPRKIRKLLAKRSYTTLKGNQ